MSGNSWPNLSLILLSTAAVVADGMELSDAFGPSAGIETSPVETDSMHGGWQTASRYSYWIPPLPEPNAKCIGETKLRVGLNGEFSCLVVGEALCRDNAKNIQEGEEGGKFGFWRFGIDEVELDNGSTTSVVTMWDPRVNVVFSDFVGATHLCIGEIRGNDDPSAYSEERPWLIVYDEKRNDYMATLLCDGAEASLWDGTQSKRTLLKMVNNQDIDRYTSYPVSVLKLKKGNTKDPNDDDALWKINYNADQTTDVVYNQDFCRWQVHTEQPSVAPSDLPSLSPSMQPSLRPSASPTKSPGTSAAGNKLKQSEEKLAEKTEEAEKETKIGAEKNKKSADKKAGQVSSRAEPSEPPRVPLSQPSLRPSSAQPSLRPSGTPAASF